MTYTLILQIVMAFGPNSTMLTKAYVPGLPTLESCEFIASMINAEHVCIPSMKPQRQESKEAWKNDA